MTLPQYYNTVEEFSRPFVDPQNPVYQSGLRLENIETAIVACQFAAAYKSHGDAEKFAKAYIPTIRSWNECVFYGALSEERTFKQRQQIIENYYNTYQSEVANNPSEHGMGYVHAYMIIIKET